MERDWRDFKALHGNIAGARTAFEKTCETLFREIHKDSNVQQVEVKQGDGGIDIFIGNIGIEPITVIQCKFFLEEFDEVQYAQIRSSFSTAKKSIEYELKEWILCLPIVLNLSQNKWWADWKNKKTNEHSLKNNFIKLINGNELIDLLKKYSLYNQEFQIIDSLLAIDTNKKVTQILEGISTIPKKEEKSSSPESPVEILFNNYSKKNEKYYFERKEDNEFFSMLSSGNIWVYGLSGKGKTALVNRNLIQNNIEFISCDCSPIKIEKAEDILDELLYSICEKYSVTADGNQTNIVKKINSVLDKCSIRKNIYIVIDEISFPDKNTEGIFANYVTQLVTSYNKKNSENFLKFIISTIPEPFGILKEKEKASEHFQYLSADKWDDCLDDYIRCLVSHLKIQISDTSIGEIKKSSNNNPRLVKNILRKITRISNPSADDIKHCINLSINEIV